MLEIAHLANKYQTMTRAYDRGAEDGNQNMPPQEDQGETPVELEIIQLAQDDLNSLAGEQKAMNDETSETIRALKVEIPSDLSHDVDAFVTRAELKIGEVERDLLKLYSNALARQQEYRFFKTKNRLDRDADVPASPYIALAWLLFIMVLDGVANAYFFKDSNANALLGGFLLAFVISLANTAIGFCAGHVPWRYLQHRDRLHFLWALPLLVIFFTLIAMLNLAVGHYRELLLLDKDAPPEQVVAHLISAPIGLHSVQTFILVGFGIGVAMFAAYKGYTFTDSYPRYGRYFKRRLQADEEFEARLKTLQSEIGSIATDYLSVAKSQYQSANRAIQKSAAKLDDAISRNDNYATVRAGIEEACNAALKTYRDANVQVRDIVRFPAPARFSKRIALKSNSNGFDPQAFELAKLDLRSKADKLKGEYEDLAHQIPKELRRLLSEERLNERLENLKRTAKRAQREDSSRSMDSAP